MGIFYPRTTLSLPRALALLLGLLCWTASSSPAQTLVWEEHFNEATINPQTWTFDFGDGCERGICGWGNQELEYYTSRPENARIENGNLLIEARRETFGGKPFTSARLKTFGRVHFKYGTLEARIKVPDLRNGLWPAFWMLGASKNWPSSGEIDIMEMGNVNAIRAGLANKRVGAAVHWENNGSHSYTGADFDNPTDLAGGYHLFKLVWDKDAIRMYVDDNLYFTKDISQADAADLEEFHQSHYILLNMAVGGQYTGIPTADGVTAPLPAQMYVDYVKLYQNPGDELYLGQDNALAGNFGVYTENPAITARLAYGTDANLFIWNNLAPIPGATPFEGNEGLALRAAAGNWFGFGVDNTAKNLLNFADGSLKFHFKTTYNGPFKVGVKSGHGESWINFAPGAAAYGLVRDGQWHQVSIPLSAFNNPNQGMHIDLGSVTQAFMFAGDAPGAAADFYVDNIYYGGGVAANPAPTVSLTAPANDALIPTPASITLTAQAADAGGSVAKVAFYNGNALLGEDLSAPYSFTWADAPEGVYTLTARATDDGGATATSVPATVFVAAPDNPAPAVSLAATPANPAAPATVTLTANATDAAGGSIYKVDFYHGSTLLGTDLTAPYTYTWAGVAAGTYAVTARATDNGKLTTTSAPVTVTVRDNRVVADAFGVYTENAAITARLAYGTDANLFVWNNLAALPGTTPFEGSEALAFRAAPGNWFGFGVDNDTKDLSHFANGALKFHCKTTYAGPFKVGIKTGGGESWIEFPAGVQKLGLVRDGQWHEVVIPMSAFANAALATLDQAFMFAGDAPATNADFQFDNIYYSSQAPAGTAPTVSITAPAPGTPFTAPAAINITVEAADADGTVGKVEFFQGTTRLGEDATAPYSFAWTGVAAGTYALTAKATDNAGGTTTSAAVSVTVSEGSTGGGGYCGTAASGDYSWKAVTTGGTVAFTFHPLGATAGGNLAIIYIREGGDGVYPGYPMTKNAAGDFTFSKSIPAGTGISLYFTYQVGAGGPERNSAASPHSYTVGTDCATAANAAPTVSITAPAPGAAFTAPATVTITADATDADGTVGKVEFFNGADKLGEDATAPYSFAWLNAPAGTHTLTAKATDNGGAFTASSPVTITVNGAAADGYTLVWADEFTNGIGPDWVFETGRGSNGWGNNELQYYRPENASVQNGELVITARKEPFGGAEYTSARMKTQGKKAFQYGRIEARIAMPSAQGLWPAFWMLGSSIVTEGWPSCGEIDIMEHVNTEPKVHGTIHWSSDNGAYANYGGSTPVANVTVAHVYSVEWDASAIRWFVDGVKYHEAGIGDGINGTHEFHEEFFLLLNLAVGGNWPGFNVDNNAFPANMYVDYVRVYQKPAPPYAGPTVRITAPGNGATATPGATLAITASARDAVNAITKVDFFNGAALLGTDTQAPYAFNWTNVPAGTHSLTAKVTNDQGATATSAAITVQVKDNVVTGDYFGIYTEQAGIPNRLAYTQDANLWLWNNLSNITPAPAPFEGSEGLAFRAAPGNWFGFGVDNDTKNLGTYANGALHFHLKTAYAGPFKVGIKWAAAEGWIEFGPGVEKYGLRRDGQWHEVVIPFKDFAGADLATLDQAFMFAGDAPAMGADFQFDNIYYSAKPADGDGDGVAAPADCNDNDAAVFPGAPETCDGVDNDCDGQVDEGIQLASPVIAVTPSSNVYTGGNAQTLYLGYGPQSVTLTASNRPAAASYRWSPATGLSNAAVANPVFTPTAAGSYTFTVTGTNAAGCTATASVTITVVNARGTRNRNKVLVCHKGQVQEVSAAEVPVHLGHGDRLGSCNAGVGTAARTGHPSGDGAGAALAVYPNPTGGNTNVAMTGVPEGAYRLTVYDLQGRPVHEIAAGRSGSGGSGRFELDAARFAAGVYVIKLVTGNGVLIQRVVVQHP